MAKDPATYAHQKWLGYVQPVGLVVSIPEMLAANATLNQNIVPEHNRFLAALPVDKDGEPAPDIPDFPAFASDVLGWAAEDLHGAPGSAALPASLEAPLPDYNETLRPAYALREFQPADPTKEWILLVQVLPKGAGFDAVAADDSRRWQASPQARFERLLRQTKVPVGLLVNQEAVRLVYAPDKELSGHITFKLAEMITVAGRPIFAALHMLLSSERLYSVAENERLPAILASSRKYQNTVSTQLANQVVEALYELLRGFQAANDQLRGDLLREVLKKDPDHVYHGLLTSLLRLVFVLYAEDRGLLPTDEVYGNHYSVTSLYERLRADDGRYPDTMYQRYGAWAQLLVLFRLIHRGGKHGALRIPAREGYLFDPDRYLFLEGRHEVKDHPAIPRVSDGVVFNVLSKLMLLDGERLSYRTLAVEQIGSVYQAIMGFAVEVAAGPSIAIKPAKKHGAPATINLEELLRTAPEKRLKWLADNADQKLSGQAADLLKTATSIDELLAALERKIAKAVTPNVVPKTAMVFQPSDERRKSGSHYTPSSLTGPIVEAALDPVLKQLGANPTPAQILNIKVCDPAMGSAAFLVEACRQLGDALTRAWHVHNEVTAIPPDEDEALYAQRLVSQRCLYGLDKNPMATDLAKLSLWLATLAKDHPFTFLDHSLRYGEALVGLTRKQVAGFHWAPAAQQSFLEDEIRKRIERATQYRQKILNARDSTPYAQLAQELDNVDDALNLPRMVGDAIIAAFFSAEKPKLREEARKRFQALVEADLKKQSMIPVSGKVDCAVKELRSGRKAIPAFHWELEFPEVFTTNGKRAVTGGFDLIVGNPPFAGKNTISQANADGYLDWLKFLHEGSHGNADLVAHFFRKAYTLVRRGGAFGLIATNTISQGDTRTTGLRWICVNGGTIYRARKRLKWEGQAAVTVSVVHVLKGELKGPFVLDERPVSIITAYLFHAGIHDDPARLKANELQSGEGCIVLGMGFTFDDTDTKGVTTSLATMQDLVRSDPRNADRIFPYIGGEEVNNSPTHSHHRFVINFEDWPLKRDDIKGHWLTANDKQRKEWLRTGIVPLDYPADVANDYPDLLRIIETKVRPSRLLDNRENYRCRWWQFAERRPGLVRGLRKLERVIAVSRVSHVFAFTLLPARMVHGESLVITLNDSFSMFCTLQSRVHELWARLLASSLEDRLRYTPTDCYETFPLPEDSESISPLVLAGENYYEYRGALMRRYEIGLTRVYNSLHDSGAEIPEILKLRELHDTMDRVVLDAYGWADIQPKCEFIPEFDDEEDEDDNSRPKKKKYRYRWPDDVRDEVLARLLELNRQRAMEEGQLSPIAAEGTQPVNGTTIKKSRKKAPNVSEGSTADLFGADRGDV